MRYIDYNKLDKYKIEMHDGGLSYSKSVLVANSDSKDEIKVRHYFENFCSSRADLIKVSDGDTLAISAFTRASNDENLYGFFIENLNTGEDSDIALPISKEEYPVENYDFLKYAGKYLAGALKKSGYKDVKILVQKIMGEDECNKYIYACEIFGDESVALNRLFDGMMTFEKHTLEDSDALICFRPEDFKTLVDNIEDVKDILEVGGPNTGYCKIKGFIYLNNDIKCNSYYGEENYHYASFADSCNGNGLYLCVDVPYRRRDFDYQDTLIDELKELEKKLNVKLTIAYGYGFEDNAGANISDSAIFITDKEELKAMQEQIVIDSSKYKANYSLKDENYFENIFKDKKLNTLVFSDVLVTSSVYGFNQMRKKLDEIRELLAPTDYFVKGFVYVNTQLDTTDDCDVNFEDNYPNHSYIIESDALYLCIGSKENYMSNYHFVDDIANTIGEKCRFNVVVNAMKGTHLLERPEFIEYAYTEEEVEEVFKELNSEETCEKYILNKLLDWDVFESITIPHGVASKTLNENKFLLAVPERDYSKERTYNLTYTVLDKRDVSLDDYKRILEINNDYINFLLDDEEWDEYEYELERFRNFFVNDINTINNNSLFKANMSLYFRLVQSPTLKSGFLFEMFYGKEEDGYEDYDLDEDYDNEDYEAYYERVNLNKEELEYDYYLPQVFNPESIKRTTMEELFTHRCMPSTSERLSLYRVEKKLDI